MIYVDQKQLDQVEYLIEKSAQGFHVLFDNQIIRKAFKNQPTELEESKISKSKKNSDQTAAEKHIETLILQPTLISKRAYLERLDSEMFHKVVRTYFSIVENNIFESAKYDQ